jgi:hypothetical protein
VQSTAYRSNDITLVIGLNTHATRTTGLCRALLEHCDTSPNRIGCKIGYLHVDAAALVRMLAQFIFMYVSSAPQL